MLMIEPSPVAGVSDAGSEPSAANKALPEQTFLARHATFPLLK